MDTLPGRPDGPATGWAKADTFDGRKPSGRSTARTVFIVLGIVAAVILVAALIASVAVTRGNLSDTEDRFEAVQAQATDLRDQVADLNDELAQEAEDAAATIDQQSARLRYCVQAVSLGVKMDGVLNDLVDNALYSGSLSQWITLQNRYSTLGSEWEDAAAACSPAGGYSFS